MGRGLSSLGCLKPSCLPFVIQTRLKWTSKDLPEAAFLCLNLMRRKGRGAVSKSLSEYLLFLPSSLPPSLLSFLLFFLKIYFQREGDGGRQRGRETSMWKSNIDRLASPIPPTPWSGPRLRYVPWLGIELVTFCFGGQCPTHRATPVRALFLNKLLKIKIPKSSSRVAKFCLSAT